MEQFTLESLKDLAQHEQTPKISAFIPILRGEGMPQNATRYKNLLRQVEQELRARELPSNEIDEILEPMRALQGDTEFWAHPDEQALAIFASPGEFHVYELPFPAEERMIVSRHYVLTPVLPAFTANGTYYILALSQNQVRMFGANKYRIWPIALPENVPTSMAEALQGETYERELQFHSPANAGMAGGIFHGSDTPDVKEQVHRYLNLVDAALKPMLRDKRVPLVLAGVEYLHPIYRDESEYQHVMGEGIVGNPENMSLQELHEQSWPIVEPVFHQEVSAAFQHYGDLSATEKTTDNLREVVPAAVFARIDTLLCDPDAIAWGTFDPETSKVVIRREGPRTYDDLSLVDFAAMHTLLNGGRVITLGSGELPNDSSPVAAVLRY